MHQPFPSSAKYREAEPRYPKPRSAINGNVIAFISACLGLLLIAWGETLYQMAVMQ